MIEVETSDGTIVEFPDNTPRDVMRAAMQKRFGTAQPGRADVAPAAPRATDAAVDHLFAQQQAGVTPEPTPTRDDGVQYAMDTALIATQEGRKGMSSLLGLPIDAMNAVPMIANLIPGVDGVGPISDKPLLGSEMIDDIMTGYGAIKPAPEPQDAFQNVVGRTAREVGSAIPIIGASGAMAARGVDAVRKMNPIARNFVEPMAVAPAEAIGKELRYAVGAGMGAGIANEAVGNPQDGDNFWSDFFGSMGGVGATPDPQPRRTTCPATSRATSSTTWASLPSPRCRRRASLPATRPTPRTVARPGRAPSWHGRSGLSRCDELGRDGHGRRCRGLKQNAAWLRPRRVARKWARYAAPIDTSHARIASRFAIAAQTRRTTITRPPASAFVSDIPIAPFYLRER